MELEEKMNVMAEEYCKLQTVTELAKESFEKNNFEMVEIPNLFSLKNLWYNKEHNIYASLMILNINKLVMGYDIDKSNNNVIVSLQATFEGSNGLNNALEYGIRKLRIRHFRG